MISFSIGQIDQCALCFKHGGEAKLRAKCCEIARELTRDDDEFDAIVDDIMDRIMNK